MPRPFLRNIAAKKLALRTAALGYLAVILIGPVVFVFYRAFEDGVVDAWNAVTTPQALHAFELTLIITAVAVPANTIFGIVCALAIVRHPFRGKGLLNAVVDLPLALSPVVVGVSLFLLYGREGWLGWFRDSGVEILFALPSMILATIFVSLPFVVREVVPVLREIGVEQEQAAATLGASRLQIFSRITLPALRWAIAYGVVLTSARSLGEYGAVAVVSGHRSDIATATLFVDESYQRVDYVGVYATSVVLALMAASVLVLMNLLQRKERGR